MSLRDQTDGLLGSTVLLLESRVTGDVRSSSRGDWRVNGLGATGKRSTKSQSTVPEERDRASKMHIQRTCPAEAFLARASESIDGMTTSKCVRETGLVRRHTT